MGFTLYRSQSEENCCLNQVKTGCFGSKPMTPIIKSISIKKQVPNKNTHQNQFKIKRGYLLGQPLFTLNIYGVIEPVHLSYPCHVQ